MSFSLHYHEKENFLYKPPIPKSVCKEEMQNANLDTDQVIIEYITDAHGNRIKKNLSLC